MEIRILPSCPQCGCCLTKSDKSCPHCKMLLSWIETAVPVPAEDEHSEDKYRYYFVKPQKEPTT